MKRVLLCVSVDTTTAEWLLTLASQLNAATPEDGLAELLARLRARPELAAAALRERAP